jgi:hypothetical protein
LEQLQLAPLSPADSNTMLNLGPAGPFPFLRNRFERVNERIERGEILSICPWRLSRMATLPSICRKV